MIHYSNHRQPTVRMLSDEQVHDLHFATLELLARVGVEVREPRGRELLRQAGAQVEGERVRIPAFLVEHAIQAAPERVVLAKRTGERTVALERDRVYFGTGSDTPNTVDPDTGERRRSRRADVARFATLCDALPEYDFIMSMGVASDVPATAPFLFEFADMVAGSSKPIVFTAHDVQDMEDIYAIACAVAGGEAALRRSPFLLQYCEPITPLVHSPMGVRKLLFCADHHLPVAYVSGMSSGGSAPVTLAGACVVASAECLSGLVMHQLASPGAPFVYGANVNLLDMATLNFAYAGPELPTTSAAFADLARYYHLPVWGLAGATDANVVDAQAGMEATMQILMAVLSRGNLVHDVGYIESGLTSSMEMVVLCNEIIGAVRLLAEGIPTDAESLALDVIEEVGPGGHFLGTEHTARHYRTSHFLPSILNRSPFEKWQEAGGESVAQRANDKARQVLADHQSAPLPGAAQEVIEKVLQKAAVRR